MDTRRLEKIGLILFYFVGITVTSLCLVYFLRENPFIIPLSFLPIGVIVLYHYLSKLDGKSIKVIPQTGAEFIITNLGLLILYIVTLISISGYLYIKVVFLILYLLILAYTTWGYIKKNLDK